MNSSDVVAIESTGSGRDVLKFRTNLKPKKQYKHYPYFVDPQIVPRVKQYLEDNKHKVYVDVDEMVADLRKKYRDYANKKRAAFKSVVEKAFSVVLQTYGMADQETQPDIESESSDISDIGDDSEDLDLIMEKNHGNNQLVNMYMQKKVTVAAKNVNSGGNKELIDISSDEEEVQTPSKRAKTSESQNHNDSKPLSDIIENSSNSQTQSNSLERQTNARQDPVTSPNNMAKSSGETVNSAAPDRPKRKRQAGDKENGTSTSSPEGALQRRRREVPVSTPCKSFKDVGGCSKVLQEVCKLLVHIRHPEIFEQVGISPLRGFLLHGPPGCGKTLLANAIAGELGVPLLKVAATELVAGVSGESEERIRDLFDQALSLAPCVLFLDEVDAITPNRNNAQREMERRIVAQLLTCLDELGDKEGGNQVLVVGATNRPDSLDPALRRAGRFDREVCIGIPDRDARAHILRVVCGRLALAPEVASDNGIEKLAGLTPGFVGADLTALAREAAMCAINRIFGELNSKNSNEPEVVSCKNTEGGENPKDVCDQNLSEKHPSSVEPHETITAEVQRSEEVVVEEKRVGDTANICNVVTDNSIEVEGELVTEVVENDVQEVIIHQDITEKENSTENVNACENEMPQASEIQNLESEKEERTEGVLLVDEASIGTIQEILVISPEDKGEKRKDESIKEPFPNKKNKIACEVEVLEVEMVDCNGKPSEDSIELTEPVVLPEESIITGQPTVKTVEGEMILSQKLNPLSAWSSELCQLLSWLKEKPILTPAQLSSLCVTMPDFYEALHLVQPSAKREGFATVPDVTWDDIGSLSKVRTELQLAILAPVRYSVQFSKLGLDVPAGVLLCGPPGCGKTLLAKAVANEAGINFISVKGPELLNMYVGESERAVRQVFQRARNSAPCVIFFDELDALCPKRSDSGDNGVSSRVVNQLLTEMDGIEGRSAVFLMAASNRPDIIDPAVLRPGRLDKILYVGLPNAEDRIDILRALTKNGTRPLLAPDVNLAQIAGSSSLQGYTGADLAALVREAGVQSLQEFINSNSEPESSISIALRHFESALGKIRPSITLKDRKHYEKLEQTYSSAPPVKAESMDTM